MANGVSLMAGAFGRRLKELRQKAEMSQEDVARAAGVSLSAITKLESGRVEPTWATVRGISKALGVSILEFDVDDAPEVEGPKEEKPAPKKPKGKK